MRPVARTLLWTSIIGASFIVIYLRGMVAADAWHWVGAKSEVAIVLHEGEIWVRYNHVAPRPNTPLFRFIPAWMMATGRITDESRLPKKGIHHYSSRQIRMEFLQFYPIRSQFLVSWTSDPDILRMTGCRTIVAPIWLAWLVPLTYYLLHRLLALGNCLPCHA